MRAYVIVLNELEWNSGVVACRARIAGVGNRSEIAQRAPASQARLMLNEKRSPRRATDRSIRSNTLQREAERQVILFASNGYMIHVGIKHSKKKKTLLHITLHFLRT